jgi:hypothetical protein
MFSATRFVIRYAAPADVPELVRLGWATQDRRPHVRAQAAGIAAYRRTPSVADRIRERTARRLAFDA